VQLIFDIIGSLKRMSAVVKRPGKICLFLVVSLCFLFSCMADMEKEEAAAAYFTRAYQLVMSGYPHDALPLLTLAIEKKPDYTEAYYNRGVVYYLIKEYPKAISDLTVAIKLNPKLAGAYTCRGSSYLMMQNERAAFEDYREAARLGDTEARDYLKNKGITW